jgi:hypothetical protein
MGRFEVAPSELQSAAMTLRGVESELYGGNPRGAGGLSVGDVGSPELAAAAADFCTAAEAVASALASAVTAAGANTFAASDAYATADNSSMPATKR